MRTESAQVWTRSEQDLLPGVWLPLDSLEFYLLELCKQWLQKMPVFQEVHVAESFTSSLISFQ